MNAAASPPRSILRRIRRPVLVVGTALVLVVALLPTILSQRFFVDRALARSGEVVTGEVSVGDVSLGWFSGLQVKDLNIAQPPGMAEGEALVVDELRVRPNWFAIFGEGIEADVEVLRPRVRVDRTEDGLNWSKVFVDTDEPLLLAEALQNLDLEIEIFEGTMALHGKKGTRIAEIGDLALNFTVLEGEVHLGSDTPAAFAGGELMLKVVLDSTADDLPAEIEFSWVHGQANGTLLPLLQYVVPLFADLAGPELEELLTVDFQSLVDLQFKLGGPTAELFATPLAAIDHWTGSGGLKLLETRFKPSPVFRDLLTALDKKDHLDLHSIITDFELRDGSVWGPDIKVEDRRSFSLSGKTDLDGKMAYSLDLRSLLEGRGTGDKVLEVLGDRPLGAELSGTLKNPLLQLDDLARQAITGGVDAVLERLLQDDPVKAATELLDIFGRKKRDKDG